MLVAMKGHPGCGKSTLARGIGKALQWPVLDKDDIRDCTRPLQQALGDSGRVLLNEMAYQVLWRLAETQLQLGLSVIVDCPLSRPSLFTSASTLAASYHKRLIIIECVPSDANVWRRRLEERDAGRSNFDAESSLQDGPPQGWHKPGCWEDLEALIEGYQGCWDYDITCHSSRKLIVDTTAPLCSADALVSAVLQWLDAVTDDTPSVSYVP